MKLRGPQGEGQFDENLKQRENTLKQTKQKDTLPSKEQK